MAGIHRFSSLYLKVMKRFSTTIQQSIDQRHCLVGQLENVTRLIDAGADVNLVYGHKKTALHYAAAHDGLCN